MKENKAVGRGEHLPTAFYFYKVYSLGASCCSKCNLRFLHFIDMGCIACQNTDNNNLDNSHYTGLYDSCWH